MRQVIANYFVAIGLEEVAWFIVGGLFAGRLYGVFKRLYGHVEGAVAQVTGAKK